MFSTDFEFERPRSWAEPGEKTVAYKYEPPAPQVVQRKGKFFKQVSRVSPQMLAELHKNLVDALSQKYTSTRDIFRAFQEEQSGSVSFKEFKKFIERHNLLQGVDRETMEAFFALADDKGDGKIDYQEFCRWIKPPDKHENLMVGRENPYSGERGGMTYTCRADWIRGRIGGMCE